MPRIVSHVVQQMMNVFFKKKKHFILTMNHYMCIRLKYLAIYSRVGRNMKFFSRGGYIEIEYVLGNIFESSQRPIINFASIDSNA